MKYEQVIRIEKVKVSYRRGNRIAEDQESKVYRVRVSHYPSGSKYECLVWSKELNKCVWIREDDVVVLSMSITPIHRVW